MKLNHMKVMKLYYNRNIFQGVPHALKRKCSPVYIAIRCSPVYTAIRCSPPATSPNVAQFI